VLRRSCDILCGGPTAPTVCSLTLIDLPHTDGHYLTCDHVDALAGATYDNIALGTFVALFARGIELGDHAGLLGACVVIAGLVIQVGS
jgi:hypothetical protein